MINKSKFKLSTNYQPAGDQPKAIAGLVKGVTKILNFKSIDV